MATMDAANSGPSEPNQPCQVPGSTKQPKQRLERHRAPANRADRPQPQSRALPAPQHPQHPKHPLYPQHPKHPLYPQHPLHPLHPQLSDAPPPLPPAEDGQGHDSDSANLQHYPIRSHRPGHDPLVRGIASIAPDLGSTLFPMLQQPIPRTPEDIAAPNCRSVQGINGAMIQVAPAGNIQITTSPPVDAVMSSPIHSPYHHFIQTSAPLQTPAAAAAASSSSSSVPGFQNSNGASNNIHDLPQEVPQAPSKKNGKKKQDDVFKTEFKFVVNEDAKEARNVVRKHVMREFRRKERWELGLNKVSKSKKPTKKESKTSAKSKAKTLPKVEDAIQSPPLTLPGQMSLDNAAGLVTSFDSGLNRQGDSPENITTRRRDSASMSVSVKSDSTSASDSDRFAAMMSERNQALMQASQQHLPFAKYVRQGRIIEVDQVEEAIGDFERANLPYKEDPWAEVARAEINPFSTHVNIGSSTASQALLHHYVWVMPSLMDEIVTGTVFHRIGWLYSSVATHDPTPFHTVVGYTLGHIAMLRGQDEPAMAIEHKEKSLKLIHRRLADRDLVDSDGTAGAIANIASYELIDCNPDRFAMHMQGLARLIKQRGGIEQLASNPALETVLIRLDTIRAYMTIAQPRFPTWASLRSLPPIAINIGPSAVGWFERDVGGDTRQYHFCEDAIRLINAAEDVLLLMRSLSPTIPFTPDPSFRSLLIESVLHHLRRSLFVAAPEFENDTSRRVLRLAFIILLDIAAAEFFDPPGIKSPLRTYVEPRGPLENTLPAGNQNTEQPERKAGGAQAPKDKKGMGLTRLRERFPSIEKNRHAWGRSVEMIVAVLMQAERMALERPFRAWYVADIVTLCMRLGESDWQAIEKVLMNDIMSHVSQERSQAQMRAQSGMDSPFDLWAWDLGETVQRFWNNWNSQPPTPN